MEFADKVRNLLKARGLSQTDLAEALGTNQQQVSRWLEANTPPKWLYLLKMARVFDVTADYLIDPDQSEPPARDASEFTAEERALIELYRDLELDKREAVRRLVTPLGQPWLPGSVRDFTASDAARAREARRPDPPAPRTPTVGHSVKKPPPKKKGTA